ncbi:MAG: DUF3108 domain-containing protein [Limisphaerales bacterium]
MPDTAGVRPDTNFLPPLRVLPNEAFGPGEYLEFEVGYGFIKAGTATLEVRRAVNYKGYQSLELVSTAKSYPALSKLYYVEDYNYSILDYHGLFPWRYQKDVHEGRYQAFRWADFDQKNKKIFTAKDTLAASEYVQDALTALYYVRTVPLKVDQTVTMEVFSDGKKYSLEVKVLKKEKVTVPAGTFRTVVVEPLLKTPGIFQQTGKIKVWLTDDRLRLPVLMKSRVLIGSISAQLKVFKLGERR